jgi:hypothetical protein
MDIKNFSISFLEQELFNDRKFVVLIYNIKYTLFRNFQYVHFYFECICL